MTDWKQQTFLGNFLPRGTKTLAGVPRARRVKRIYFRKRETIARCDAGENERTKKNPPKSIDDDDDDDEYPNIDPEQESREDT